MLGCSGGWAKPKRAKRWAGGVEKYIFCSSEYRSSGVTASRYVQSRQWKLNPSSRVMRPALVGTQSGGFLGGRSGTSIPGSNITPRIANQPPNRGCMHTPAMCWEEDKEKAVLQRSFRHQVQLLLEAFYLPSYSECLACMQSVPTAASRGCHSKTSCR